MADVRSRELSVTNTTFGNARDWAGNIRSYGPIWGLPIAAIAIGLTVDVPVRTVVWVVALGWMGTACVLNARRCGRTHCKYTGPYFFAMIVPVLALGTGVLSAGLYEWLAVGVVILFGSKIVWWGTERAWGKFS
jgi:hypothetical protein